MFATLEAKLLVIALGVSLLAGASAGGYALYQHGKALQAQVTQLQAANELEKANTAVAERAASSLSAALDARQVAQATAAQNTTAAHSRIAAAEAASPAVASTVVPESYWQAIYGAPDAK